MYHETILTGESVLLLIASLGLLTLSIWKKEELASEASWARLIERFYVLRLIFALSFVSIILYILAQFTSLIQLSATSVEMDGIDEIIETIHLLVLAAAAFAMIPLISEMRSAKNAV